VEAGEDRRHDPDDPFAALVHSGILRCSLLFRQHNMVRLAELVEGRAL
jgi:hypothetical protein